MHMQQKKLPAKKVPLLNYFPLVVSIIIRQGISSRSFHRVAYSTASTASTAIAHSPAGATAIAIGKPQISLSFRADMGSPTPLF